MICSHINKMSYVTRLFKCIVRYNRVGVTYCRVQSASEPCVISRLRGRHGFHSLSTQSQVNEAYSSGRRVCANGEGSRTYTGDTEIGEPIVYVNDLCMQVDQLMLKCKDPEDLLVLLVTHRGVMYLHNLVTALKLLQGFAEQDRKKSFRPDADDLYFGYKEVFDSNAANLNYENNSITRKELKDGSSESPGDLTGLTETEQEVIKRAKEEILQHFEDPANRHYLASTEHSRPVSESIVRDERYDLLMHDLYANRNNLDIESACHVIIALDSLQQKYFRLYNGILRHLMRVPFDTVDPKWASHTGKLLLKACHCYVKAGYYDIPLYSKVCREIYKKPIEHPASHIGTDMLMDTLKLFSKVDFYDSGIFSSASRLLPNVLLTPDDISHVALAYSAHKSFTRVHDRVLEWVQDQVKNKMSEFTTVQLALCVYSFAKMRLYFPEVYDALAVRLTTDLENATRSYAKTALTIPQMAIVVDDIANYAPDSPSTRKLIDSLLLYLEDFIDDVDETSAIRIASSICATGTEDLNRYMVAFIWRMIGRGTDWERCKYRVFAIWLCHVIQFPDLVVNIPKLCVISGMREWLLRHGNGPQFPEALEEIAAIMKHDMKMEDIAVNGTLGGHQMMAEKTEMDPISSLSSVDVMNGGRIKIIMNELCCRNYPAKPIGVDLMIQTILTRKGFTVYSVNYQHWTSMGIKEKLQYLDEMLQQVD